MSEFKNVTDEDREVLIDGRRIAVAAGSSFIVTDEHDASLVEQPHFKKVSAKQVDKSASAPEQGDN